MAAAEPRNPVDLLYHPEHDWARVEGDVATFGMTWFAQDQLGEIVYADLPAVGRVVAAGEPYAEVESVKAVSDVVAPLSGDIVEINGQLADSPSTLNDYPYGEGWLVRVRLSDPQEASELLSVEQYEALIA